MLLMDIDFDYFFSFTGDFNIDLGYNWCVKLIFDLSTIASTYMNE